MHLLIIGCGYLGLRAARAGLQMGHTISALTRNRDRATEWESLGIRTVVGNVLDPASLHSLPAADLCLHAVGHDRSSTADKRTVYVDGLRNVLSEIQQRVPRLIFISSTSVYGQAGGEIVDEASPCEPDTEGGQICVDAEAIVRRFYPSLTVDPRSVILRLSGIYGPGRLIARTEQLMQQTPISGNPDAWLNLIHVDDAVQAVWKLAEKPLTSALYLLSDQSPIRRRDFYTAIANKIGAPPPLFADSHDQSLNKRCDSRRIREELPLNLLHPNAIQALEQIS